MLFSISAFLADTGATPLTPGDSIVPARTVEYHRPSRNSAHYSSGTDMSLGMISSGPHYGASTSSSPRVPTVPYTAQPPSAFRSPPITSPAGYDPASMQPSRAAPPPPGFPSTQRDSGLPASPAQGYTAGSSARPGAFNKSNSNSPNPDRFSAGAGSSSYVSLNAVTASGLPPRPTRAGTMPLLDLGQMNNPVLGSGFNDPIISPSFNPTSSPALPTANGPSFPQQSAPPPVSHQPFTTSPNLYVTQLLGKGMDDTKIGLGMGLPMTVTEPKEKDLPKEPATRSRSGTGKSLGDKKSIFGTLTSKLLRYH